MIEKHKNDRAKLNELLVMHNIKLVFNIAKKYMSLTNDFDGLAMNGVKGLAEAASRFDITKNIKFVTYAHWWVRKYILETFDKRRTYIDQHAISLSTPIRSKSTTDSSKVLFENIVDEHVEPTQQVDNSIEHSLSSIEQTEVCKSLIDRLENDTSLSAVDKNVFIDYFYNREKTRDIAAKYGLDVLKVNRIRNSILGKMKNMLQN